MKPIIVHPQTLEYSKKSKTNIKNITFENKDELDAWLKEHQHPNFEFVKSEVNKRKNYVLYFKRHIDVEGDISKKFEIRNFALIQYENGVFRHEFTQNYNTDGHTF